jgi:hypothetical protein
MVTSKKMTIFGFSKACPCESNRGHARRSVWLPTFRRLRFNMKTPRLLASDLGRNELMRHCVGEQSRG